MNIYYFDNVKVLSKLSMYIYENFIKQGTITRNLKSSFLNFSWTFQLHRIIVSFSIATKTLHHLQQHGFHYKTFTVFFFSRREEKLEEASQNSNFRLLLLGVAAAFGPPDSVYQQSSTTTRRPKISIFSGKKRKIKRLYKTSGMGWMFRKRYA